MNYMRNFYIYQKNKIKIEINVSSNKIIKLIKDYI